MRRLVVVLVLALASPAAALPGDEPITPVSPDRDAVVPADPNGLAVVYTCPVYRSSDAGGGFVVYGGPDEYGAALSTTPETGTDGLLRDDKVVARGRASEPNTIPEGQCETDLGTGRSDGPENTPGTYYWQAYRICTACDGDYEATEVRKLVVRGSSTLRVAPGWRAFAGYPVPIELTAKGVPDGTQVTLERRAGPAWKPIGTDYVLSEAGETFATLAKGRQTLRARAQIGDQVVTSPARVVQVSPDRHRATGRGDDGTYTGAGGTKLTVAKRGREVRDFQTRVTMVCPSVGINQIQTSTGVAIVKRARIDPLGHFVGATTRGDYAALVLGRIAGGRLRDGRADLSVGTCTGSTKVVAKR